jgi:hypothetical protein
LILNLKTSSYNPLHSMYYVIWDAHENWNSKETWRQALMHSKYQLILEEVGPLNMDLLIWW